MREDQAKKVIDFLVSQANVCTRSAAQEHKSDSELILYKNYTARLTTKEQICEIGLVRDDWRMFCPFYANTDHCHKYIYFVFHNEQEKQHLESNMNRILLDKILEFSAAGHDVFASSVQSWDQFVFLKAGTTLEELLVTMAVHGLSADTD